MVTSLLRNDWHRDLGTGSFDLPDAELVTRVGIALDRRQRVAWRVVRVIANNGWVTLRGVVPLYYDRQLVVAVARHVAGVRRVEDELTVVNPPARKVEAEAGHEAPFSNHGGTELGSERPNPFQQLPVLSPSLEDILAAQPQSTCIRQ